MNESVRSVAVVKLAVIAAKAKQLEVDLAANRLWPGDLSRGLSEIYEQLRFFEGIQDR